MSSEGAKYFLYIPVWATTQQPPPSGSSSMSSASSSGSPSSSQSTEGSTEASSSGGSGSSASSGSGGSSGGGSSGGGGTSGGGGSSSGGGGSSGGSSNCLLYGTLVTLADGRRVPIESLRVGDEVASLFIPDLPKDVPFGRQFEWLATNGLANAARRSARIAVARHGEHGGFYVINRRIKATFEHPFLVRRGDEWGFCSAELLTVGDHLITSDGEEVIETLERIDAPARTVSIYVPGTNTYLAEGVWTHNTFPSQSSSGSGGSSASSSASGSSSSGGATSKSSGSSFSSSSASGTIGVSTSGGSSPSQNSSSSSASGGGGPGIG